MHQSQRLEVVLDAMPDKDRVLVDKLRERPPHARHVEHRLVQIALLHAAKARVEVEHGDAGRRADVLVEEDRAGRREDRDARERHARRGVDHLAVESDDVDGRREIGRGGRAELRG